VNIRLESAADFPAIRAVEEAAFRRPREANLVERLRADGDMVFSLVATADDKVVGHIAFSKMTAPFRALGLGPIAVMPGSQRKGIGTRLIEEGISQARLGAWEGIFCLGAPAYYQRFGFDPGKAAGFATPYAGAHFMVLPLKSADLPVKTGKIAYPSAFSAMGC
jgi:putative acetyltransferase